MLRFAFSPVTIELMMSCAALGDATDELSELTSSSATSEVQRRSFTVTSS